LQGKFSLEYAVAAALLDPYPGFESFSDPAVLRPEAQRLVGLVETTLTPGGHGLLGGEVTVMIELSDRSRHSVRLEHPLGSPRRPATEEVLAAKVAECGPDVPELLEDLDWPGARTLLLAWFPQA
jgi:2-methylcitrate dehydratase PrpD